MRRIGGIEIVSIGYFVIDGVLIAVDLFSQHHNAMKKGEVRLLDPRKGIKKQIFEALSGKPWDESIDHIDRIMSEENWV